MRHQLSTEDYSILFRFKLGTFLGELALRFPRIGWRLYYLERAFKAIFLKVKLYTINLYDEDLEQHLRPQIMAYSEQDAKTQIYMRFPEYEILDIHVMENTFSSHRKSLVDWLRWIVPKRRGNIINGP